VGRPSACQKVGSYEQTAERPFGTWSLVLRFIVFDGAVFGGL
jgi:hypothetical protein